MSTAILGIRNHKIDEWVQGEVSGNKSLSKLFKNDIKFHDPRLIASGSISETRLIAVCENKDDAKRIKECVNAMKGIEKPQEFMDVVKQLELDAYHQMKAERDELIGLIESMNNLLSSGKTIEPKCLISRSIKIAYEKYSKPNS